MRYMICLLVLVPVLGACQETISFEERERFHARAESEEASVRDCVKRIQWAQSKVEEYYPVLEQAEADLASLRGEVRQLRDRNARLARDLATLNDEAGKLEADKNKLSGEVATKNAEIAALKSRLTELKESHAAAAPKIDSLLVELGAAPEGK